MILATATELEEFLQEYKKHLTPLAVDTETDGVKAAAGDMICGVGLGYRGLDKQMRTCYVSVRHEVWKPKMDIFGDVETVDNLDPTEVMDLLRPILENKKILKIAHNAKFETQVFQNEGIFVQNLHDTMFMCSLADPTMSNALKTRLKAYFGEDLTFKDNIDKWFAAHGMNRKHKKALGYKYVPLEILSPYTEILDCAGCVRLFEHLAPRMSEHREIYKMEWELLPVIANMEMRGFPISVKHVQELLEEVTGLVDEARDWMFELAGHPFSTAPESIAQVLYEELGLDIPQQRGTGITDAGTLKNVDHDLARAVLAFRGLDKVRGTYLEPLLEHAHNGRIHASFLQVKSWGKKEDFGDEDEIGGADTGRLASIDPNMQNIGKPRKFTIRGKEHTINIRKCFRLPDEEQDQKQLLLVDWSQVEMRLLAEESGDPYMVSQYQNNSDLDLHSATAEKVFGTDKSQMDLSKFFGDPNEYDTDDKKRSWIWKNLYRQKAKAVNFGIVYGMGVKTLAANLGMTTEEARKFINKYFAQFPKVKEFNDQTIKFTERNGYVTTKFGRRRILEKEDSYKAPNTKIQGGAADMNKIAMARVEKALEPYKSRIVLNIHDEITIEHWKDEVDVPRIIIEEMERWPEFQVPIVADIEIASPSWGDKRDLTKEEKALYRL